MDKKSKIPKALREQIWLHHMGEKFQGKCNVVWCKNVINAFDFQCGHNVPESKGGETTFDNLIPICSRCNLSMANQYTIDEWNTKFAPKPVSTKGCMMAALERFRYVAPTRLNPKR